MFDLYTYCPWCSTLTIYGLVVTVYWLLFDCLWRIPRTHASREEKNKKDEVPPRSELGSRDSHPQRLRGSRSGRRKFSSTGGTAPGRDPFNQNSNPFFRNFSGWTEPIQWVLDWNFLKFWLSGSRPLSSDFKQTISKRLSECWLLTGQKMLCVIVPSRQLASPEFFSCVPTRRLLSRILVRFVHRGCACNSQGKLSLSNFLKRNEGAIDDSWKHFGCYQRDHSNLHRENSVSDRSQGIVNNIYEGHDRRKFEYIV